MKHLRLLPFLASLAASLPGAQAAPVSITNASFEAQGAGDGGIISAPITGWSTVGTSRGVFNTGSGTRYYNHPDFVDTGATGGARGTMEGRSFAFISGDAADAISQVLAATLEANTQYSLTVALGHRTVDSGNATLAPNVTLELLAGGVSLGSATYDVGAGVWTATDDVWADATLQFTTSAAPEQLGQALTVRISKAANTPAPPATGYMDIDNVRLDAVAAIPESSIYGLLGAGALALAAVRRRRRHR